jgi:DNA adenine methylase
MPIEVLRAPFPWFGGKSRVARQVWERFGDVRNYVEPFAGSLALLLGRPSEPHIETVNDLDCWIANFWRAIAADPEQVAQWADWPVNEADLHARHLWLVQRAEFRERMKTDPDYFDAKIAGWWVWGISQWIGDGWCSALSRKMPNVGGRGVHGGKRPYLTNHGGGMGVFSQRGLSEWFQALAARLRRVRVCCGDWSRILGPAPTTCIGITGVFLDPPYAVEARTDVYSEDSRDVAHAVREWAVEHGDNPELRIALCGYEGEHAMPAAWECLAWKANGGFANAGKNRTPGEENAGRERIWFSPGCLPVVQGELDYGR